MEKMQKKETEKEREELLEEEKENSEKDREKLEDEQKKALEQAEKKWEAFASYQKKKKIERSDSFFKGCAKQRKVWIKQNVESLSCSSSSSSSFSSCAEKTYHTPSLSSSLTKND
ncbi:uncharacterized protein MONOS_14159 [Monocercomonoides exilis]|uniref:uncharacterized protein n=1 Tax=Monocercomonoides exilis TaxID=2049356 RepID=UPI00355A1AE5|nr:hypothetical protein MONOS_14159 [Monocercomonoides exilis]|eukprot:MONOS_14159.1-p1 / transcript=MONOS_14159.1 / gene=MONOS_14159 / organism=Monocercomonoides_exilis_PA203 / gene_product=unspecified product / transcript_product=unspecified product / location=Mono_scaffold00948:11782-12397(-) / protein_length=115 / sequence_SO=supercontig / SO=protein_coding / is_pseudo=false